MHSNSLPDNQLILQRAADSCQSLDDLRLRLHCIQKQLAKARKLRPSPSELESSHPHQPKPNDEVLLGLLQEAYALQFQISLLLSATEEPIPERQRASTPARKKPVGTAGITGTGATATTATIVIDTTTSGEQEHASTGSHTTQPPPLPHAVAEDVKDIVS
ncbi:unnamed protein product [Mortierella alpina]